MLLIKSKARLREGKAHPYQEIKREGKKEKVKEERWKIDGEKGGWKKNEYKEKENEFEKEKK